MPKHLTAKRFELDLGAENEAEALVGPPTQWRGKRDLQLKFLQQFELAENNKFIYSFLASHFNIKSIAC